MLSRTALLPFTLLTLAAATGAFAQEQSAQPALRLTPSLSLGEAFANGSFSAQLRPRYNRIEEERKTELTDAFTARAVAGWRTAPFERWRLALELIHTDRIGPKHFNDNPRVTSPYPLLPDPRYAGVNQAYLDYAGEVVRLRAGRQSVRLDNERFVSDNDFRQIPMMFTGISTSVTLSGETQLRAGHFIRIRTTQGTENHGELSYLQLAWSPQSGHEWLGYAMWHDQVPGQGGQTGLSNNGYQLAGLRWHGSVTQGEGRWLYHLEAARQQRYANGDSAIRANYLRVGAGWSGQGWGGEWTARIDHEVKGSNGGRYGLQTPLTDLYAYNGWALQFVTTPREGLRDTWVSLRKPLGNVELFGELHRFRSDTGSINLGREWDVGASWRLPESRYGESRVIAQLARYRQPGNDVNKFWVALDWRY